MKSILITGSSRGIGKAIAKLAHEQGYKVILHGRSDSEQLNQLHDELTGSIKTFFDVADRDATHAAINKVLEEVETIDVLVNNAGIGRNFLSDISEMDDEKAIEEYRVNVLGVIHAIQAVIPKMLEKGSGSVVNIASMKGVTNLTTTSSLTYGSTKAGVIAITKALAKTYPSVRFNVVNPGYVETDLVNDWPPETFDRIKNGTLLGRMAQTNEIAPLVMFLASDDASYITGSEFLADGGYQLSGK